MRYIRKIFLLLAGIGLSCPTFAQQTNDVSTEVELGAIFTSGNTEDENIKYKVTVDWLRSAWEYQFTTEGFRSSKEDVLAAQRLYHVGRARRNLSEDSYWMTRVAYEDDRFSGYDYQADATVSYGRNFLQSISNMSLEGEIGAGYRRSESATEDFGEGIIRIAAKYEWGLSETANLIQNLSSEFGEETSIHRSETAIESEIMENLA
jgi:putative salt-induced outer membrane protein